MLEKNELTWLKKVFQKLFMQGSLSADQKIVLIKCLCNVKLLFSFLLSSNYLY